MAPVNLRLIVFASLLALGGLVLGCPPASSSNEGSPQKPAATCAKEGQSCEYAPGKLGLCTAKPNCDGPTCLTCMSLH